MTTDVVLDDRDGTWITLKADAINAVAADLILDHPGRRNTDRGRFRRALVHNTNDGLTVNFADDYPGGVRVNSASINLKATNVRGDDIKLPKSAQLGDIIMVVNKIPSVIQNGALLREPYDSCTLWLCTGASPIGSAQWQQVPLGEAVFGTE